MRKHLLIASGIAALVIAGGFPADANAQRPYVGVYGGGNWPGDADLDFQDVPLTNGDADFKTGFLVGGVAGISRPLAGFLLLGSPLNLRSEVDINYRRNSTDALSAEVAGIATGRTSDVAGNVDAVSGLANLWVDLNLPLITPYAGGGIGVSRVSMNDVRIMGQPGIDDHDTVFAYQLGVGTAVGLNPVTALTLDYRYFVARNPEFTDAAGGSIESEYKNHSVMVGLRFGF